MNAVLANQREGDGRVRVDLEELIALRDRVIGLTSPVHQGRARRAGAQPSRLYGRGMDYAESRVYQPGDDVRRLDWRLTARSGRLHTKLFQEEREGQWLILLDVHPTMRFGTRVRFKSVQAARAAALAAWYVVKAGKRVGLMTFGPYSCLQPPRGGMRGGLDICDALAQCDAVTSGQSQPLSEVLQQAMTLRRGADGVLLISDGHSSDPASGDRLFAWQRRAALRLLIVADALELKWPPAGSYPIEHQGQRRMLRLHSQAQRAAFQQSLGEGPARLTAMAASLGVPHRLIDTAADPLDAVVGLLSQGGATR